MLSAPPKPPRPAPLRSLLAGCLATALLSCSPEGDTAGGGPDLVAQGETVYRNVCIACHHADPSRDGSVGPANAGASEELLTAKLLRGEYPPGYAPKRPGSAAMPRFPYLAEQIPALAAYLAQFPAEASPPGAN